MNEKDQALTDQIALSLKTIGQTLPLGHEVFFFRDVDDQRVRMQHVLPDGSDTEYVFTKHLAVSDAQDWKAGAALREEQLATTLRDLIAQIHLHTDCMDGHLDRDALDPYIDAAESLVGSWPEFSLEREVH